MSSERERIERLRRALVGRSDPRVLVGLGDDAAVIAPASEPLVWTVDAAVEGVHFRRDLLAIEDIGYRATMAAASDLGAMGAAPLGLLAALVLPPWVGDAGLDALARGQREAADALGTAVIGGNLARGSELSITTTALGVSSRPLTRAGAKPGDTLWMAGPVGLAAVGLAALERGERARTLVPEAVAAWRRPRARLAEGLVAGRVASAAIDVSDGLARDAGHLATASGVRIVLDAAAIVSAELRAAAAALELDPLALALHGGEDYALVVALPEDVAMGPQAAQNPGPPGPGPARRRDLREAGFVKIGAIEAAANDGALALRREGGAIVAIDAHGFDHFDHT